MADEPIVAGPGRFVQPGNPVVSNGKHLTNKKGHKKGHEKLGAPSANTNTPSGPRFGRQGKEATPLPKPRPDAKLPRRRQRAKSGGRDFVKGQNSHDGQVFERGGDQIPRGNITLFAKCVYHDERETLYRRLVGIGRTGTNREVLILLDWIGNRIEGRPTKKVDRTERRISKFVFTNGQDALAERRQSIGAGAAPKAASPEDLHPWSRAGWASAMSATTPEPSPSAAIVPHRSTWARSLGATCPPAGTRAG